MDPIPKDLVSNIIYSYSCPSCNARYIGEIGRHSNVRWDEHLGISCFTGQSVKDLSTIIKVHLKIKQCESDFTVIGCESNRLLSELKVFSLTNYMWTNKLNQLNYFYFHSFFIFCFLWFIIFRYVIKLIANILDFYLIKYFVEITEYSEVGRDVRNLYIDIFKNIFKMEFASFCKFNIHRNFMIVLILYIYIYI